MTPSRIRPKEKKTEIHHLLASLASLPPVEEACLARALLVPLGLRLRVPDCWARRWPGLEQHRARFWSNCAVKSCLCKHKHRSIGVSKSLHHGSQLWKLIVLKEGLSRQGISVLRCCRVISTAFKEVLECHSQGLKEIALAARPGPARKAHTLTPI